MGKGKVYLVGAGPGDSRLLTLKGLQCIRKAEVVLYDRLINPILLEETLPDAELIYCGKLPDRHFLRQETINELLVLKAQEGKQVVRLKGGDPSVFGRVGEEAEALKANGIEYEIVPGITASIAASSYAGIPVTHRDYGASFAIVTGHDKSVEGKPTIDWEALSTGIDTIAFYMGVGNIAHISEQLIAHGKDPLTPVILIQWGTYSRQQILEGNLQNIAAKVAEVKFQNPAITLVGNIVALRENLKWFEQNPFFKRNILLAKSTSEHSRIASEMKELGAEVFEFPSFQAKSFIHTFEQKVFIEKLTDAKQIYFTSPEAVKYFFDALALFETDIRQVHASFFVGSTKSMNKLKQYGCMAKLIEEALKCQELLIIGEKLTAEREKQLLAEFKTFDYAATHELTIVERSFITFNRLEEEQSINTVILPSASSAAKLFSTIKLILDDPHSFFVGKQVIAFGEKTKEQACKLGIHVDVTLNKPTLEHLLISLQNNEVIR